MKRIVLFCALGVLMGCRQAEPMTSEVITLFCATSEQSKTDALSVGDAVGVFAAVEGTEAYFMENTQWVVGSDGQTLTTSPAAYYPQERQAIRFYAYLPLGGTWSGARGSFSVPTDQSTPAALKQADLCWATGGSTPATAPVALEFEHVLARLVVTTKESVSQLLASHAFSGGTLDIKTGTFTPTTPAHLTTTGNELILPAQSLPHLVLTVSDVDYTFEAPLTLPAGQTTTLNLTLNPSTKTAALAGSSVTPWLASTATGNPTQAVANTLSIHWLPIHGRATEINKIVLTIKDNTSNTSANYTISSGISHADGTFVVPFSSAALRYPYTIEKLQLYKAGELIETTAHITGGTVYKSGEYTLGINGQPLNPPAPSDYVKIGSLYWAKGNLIAVSKENNRECKVGAPADGGLYFQFGSLIGYKGGAQANGGTGVGIPTPVVPEGTQPEAIMVWPAELVGIPKRKWGDQENVTTLNDYYFNYSAAPWETAKRNIRDFSLPISGDKGWGTLATGRYVPKGVGDPCSYYLGSNWRMPTTEEYVALCNNKTNGTFEGCNASWTDLPVPGGNFSGTQLFFPAAGTANLWGVLCAAYYWSSSVGGATKGLMFGFNNANNVTVQQNHYVRSQIFSARCVSDAP